MCETSRALLERAIEGGFNFADCVVSPDGCTMINRCVENMELLKTMGAGSDKFFHEYMEIPLKADENGVALSVLQCRNHILKPLHERFGIDVSDAAIRKAVDEHNRVCRLIRAIGEFRKEDKPPDSSARACRRLSRASRSKRSKGAARYDEAGRLEARGRAAARRSL